MGMVLIVKLLRKSLRKKLQEMVKLQKKRVKFGLIYILKSGYYKIDKIPAGVRNLNVYEKQASQNTIAVSSEDGKTFYLNGDL